MPGNTDRRLESLSDSMYRMRGDLHLANTDACVVTPILGGAGIMTLPRASNYEAEYGTE